MITTFYTCTYNCYFQRRRYLREITKMLKIKQNVVLLMEPCDSAADVSLKAGNMLLNRFCIDEDAAFETTGVYYLEESFRVHEYGSFQPENKSKGLGKSIQNPH